MEETGPFRPLSWYKRLKRAGLDIPLRTLNRWESFAHDILQPLVQIDPNHGPEL